MKNSIIPFCKIMIVIFVALIAFSAIDQSKFFIAFLCIIVLIFNIFAMDN